MSCNVTLMAAATRLPRSNRTTPSASSVLSPQSGMNPKNIPTAVPIAIACGLSLSCRSCVLFVRSQSIGFMVSEGTIGLQPDLVGPSFTLALRAIHHLTPALGNAAHMIYTGKMANERLMALALDLTRVAPRSPRAPLGIFSVIAGRALDKC